MVHHVEVGFYPNWVGADQERFFEFEGGRLALISPPVLLGGPKMTTRLVWERVGD